MRTHAAMGTCLIRKTEKGNPSRIEARTGCTSAKKRFNSSRLASTNLKSLISATLNN
jgi:hypothetical protein